MKDENLQETEQPTEKKNQGLFSYEYEETILLLSRVGKLKKLLSIVHERAKKIIGSRRFREIPETLKDEIKDIRDVSKTDWRD